MKMSVTVWNEQKKFNGSFNNVYSKIQTFTESRDLSIIYLFCHFFKIYQF